jgi:signal transduction histidine kinase
MRPRTLSGPSKGKAVSQEAGEASRLKSDFLAAMSHELRTPLTSIIGFSELIQDGEAGPVTPKQKEYLEHALASARQLLQLVNDLLDLARIESGKVDLFPEQVDPAAVIQDVRGMLRAEAETKRIEVTSEVDPTLGEVLLDPRRLRQVVQHYLSNALKFTDEGGRVTIRVRAQPPSHFRLEVEDTGLGIAAVDRQGLFTSFHQVDNGLTRKHQGTGVGLALTRRLVEAQEGWVGVESTPGEGSLFFAVLPLVAPPDTLPR